MSLRIAFDLDGVLADMDAALRRQAEQLFGAAVPRAVPEMPETRAPAPPETDAPPPDVPATTLALTSRQERQLWRHIAGIENFWEGLAEIESGSTARLGALAAERAWEIIFLTKRPRTAGAPAQVQSQRWLQAKGFAIPSVFVVQGSRGKIAAALALDAVVDDRPENCLDVVVDSKARSILMWRDGVTPPPPAARRLGIGTVHSMDECLATLAALDAQARAPRGVVARIKQMFMATSSAIDL